MLLWFMKVAAASPLLALLPVTLLESARTDARFSKSFRFCTYKIPVSNPFRICTYRKRWGGISYG